MWLNNKNSSCVSVGSPVPQPGWWRGVELRSVWCYCCFTRLFHRSTSEAWKEGRQDGPNLDRDRYQLSSSLNSSSPAKPSHVKLADFYFYWHFFSVPAEANFGQLRSGRGGGEASCGELDWFTRWGHVMGGNIWCCWVGADSERGLVELLWRISVRE